MIGAHRTLVRLRNRVFTDLARREFRALGARSVIELPVRVWGAERISLGDDVVVGMGSWLQALDPCGDIVVGDRTTLARACTISAVQRVELGTALLIAGGVYIADHNHRRDDPVVPIRDQGVDDVAPVRIGDGTWVGQNAVVLAGSVIGASSVVAANAVVRGHFPARSLIAGVPARAVRTIP